MPRSAWGAAASSTTLEKRREAHQRVLLAARAHRAQDVAAAVGLGADQERVLAQVRAVGELLDQLGRDELDRGERRAEFVRRRRDHAAERGERCSRSSAICVAVSAWDIEKVSPVTRRA